MAAYDSFFPDNLAFAMVYINVTRNDQGPIFINPQSYIAFVNEYTNEFTEIFQVQARDADGVSMTSDVGGVQV